MRSDFGGEDPFQSSPWVVCAIDQEGNRLHSLGESFCMEFVCRDKQNVLKKPICPPITQIFRQYSKTTIVLTIKSDWAVKTGVHETFTLPHFGALKETKPNAMDQFASFVCSATS